MLTKSRVFTLPGKKELTTSNYQLEVVVVDVTESPIKRPKKQKKFYSGKKKQHTRLVTSIGRPSEWSNHLHRSWQR
ncbi:hypothetical protein [Nostoc sp. MG11]|uniref:hypothetical protein n=1 Tax=Nostoc sp. MG11 TaxID=2721166 RepID=UPI0029FF212D|nr:hypothetical protein [Nostoc sp. MG11]